MSKSNTFENELMKFLFNNVNIADIGDAVGLRGSTVPGNFYVSLHTADPGETGTQATNEIAYTGYARQAVERSEDGFTIVENVMNLTEDEDFPKMTAGAGGTVTHWVVGKQLSGATVILYSGTATPNILIQDGTIPRLETATNVTEN
jgi:hypothetical protein